MPWVRLKRFPLYEVSDRGQVRRAAPGKGATRGKILKPSLRGARGALRLKVIVYEGEGWASRHYAAVHRLVAEAFHGPAPAGKPYAILRDGDPFNVAAANVFWGNAVDAAAARDARR